MLWDLTPTNYMSIYRLMAFLYFAGGFLVLVLGAELFVRSAAGLAKGFGVSPLLIGLTIVAYGTSMPELTVSVYGAWTGHASIAVGNVVGSNIFNVLFILGLSAVITPLIIQQRLVRWDVPILIGASALTLWFAASGTIGAVEGVICVSLLIGYTVFCIRQERFETQPVVNEYAQAYGSRTKKRLGKSFILSRCVLSVGGLCLLAIGSRWSVAGASRIAQMFGMSEWLIGATIIAAGTSLPEVFTSIIATLRNQRDIAVGNVIGSNIFNIFGVLGLSALVAPAGLPIPRQAIYCDIPVMIAVSVACLPIFFTGRRISRWEGLLFLLGYGLYLYALSLLSPQI